VESSRPVMADALYEYRLESGPVLADVRRDSGVFLHGYSLLALHEERLADETACHEVKCLMRAVLALYLGPRPLRTREVLRQMAVSRDGKGTPRVPSSINET
jgi:DNA repair protein RecO (recombination protein O)